MVKENSQIENLSPASGDHMGRLMMDTTKNILEALIDGDIETAKEYSKMASFSKDLEIYLKKSRKELVIERLTDSGYSVDEETDRKYEELLKTL